MIQVDLENALSFLEEEEFERAVERAGKSLQEVKEGTGKGSEWLGWRDLLANPNDAILEDIDALAGRIRADADVFIVCGIGGSYLGARAVIDALTSFFPLGEGPEIIYAGHHMSGKYLEQLIEYLEQPKADGEHKSVYLNVISKSGTTLETALSFRLLRKWLYGTYGEDADQRITCTTSAEGGALNKLVEAHGYKKFIIPDDVGGRFSVLTPVGLLPIAVAGIDIRTLFYGAVEEYERLEKDAEKVVRYAATRYVLYQKGKAVDLITSFEPELKSIGGWMQQLLGESEGKENKGMFPAVAGYSTDLHSLGQMVQQGQRNLIETFLRIEKSSQKLDVEATDDNGDGLNYLAGKSFHEINTRAYEGTLQAHVEGGVPTVTVTMEELNAQQLGSFLYFYELFTAVYVYCLEVNPFNQPGVENYKKAMYRLLGKK